MKHNDMPCHTTVENIQKQADTRSCSFVGGPGWNFSLDIISSVSEQTKLIIANSLNLSPDD